LSVVRFRSVEESEAELFGDTSTGPILHEVPEENPVDARVGESECAEGARRARRDAASLVTLIHPVADLDVPGFVAIVQSRHPHELAVLFDEDGMALSEGVPRNPLFYLSTAIVERDGFLQDPPPDPRRQVLPVARDGFVEGVDVAQLNPTNEQTVGFDALKKGDEGHAPG
jgi:hypothetical protein